MHTATVSAKGWVVIPKSIREKHGLKKGSRVQVLDYGQIVAIVPLPADPIEALHGMFEDGPSLTKELLAERERERAREDRTGD
ncbi:MAG: AbrB/MazE/SpoVT family DNA-binding domain-containing protein [Anaerolineae bacterium]|nr:AbrB/MazE/SpoVT family DNA-binding domain-containing protein [Anaerolineae bacterium]